MAAIMRSLLALLGATLSFVGAPTPALAADNLDCVDGGYSAADQARLDGFAKGFDLAAWSTQGPPADIKKMVIDRTDACAQLYGWSADAVSYALVFKMARIGLAGSEQNGALNAGHIAALRKSITPQDMQKGKLAFGQMMQARRDGTAMPSESPEMFVGRLIMRAGVPIEHATAAGGWIGATILSAYFAERFGAV
jgi:hypothetical protein